MTVAAGTFATRHIGPRAADEREMLKTLAERKFPVGEVVALASARKLDNLWQAVDARKRIGQAQGILMERFGLTDDQAFAVLLRYSQDNNIKLRAVADLLVETRSLPGQ